MQPKVGEFYIYERRTYKVLALSETSITVHQYPHGSRRHIIPRGRWDSFIKEGTLKLRAGLR